MNILYKKSGIFLKGALFGAVFLLLFALVSLFAPKANADFISDLFDDETHCAWEADSLIVCDELQFWFSYNRSVGLERAVYQLRTDDGGWDWRGAYIIFDDDGENGQIKKDQSQTDVGIDIFINDRRKRKWRQHAKGNDPFNPDNTNGVYTDYDGETNPNNSAEHFMCGLGSRAGHDCWSGRGGGHNVITPEGALVLAKISKTIDETVESDEECTEDAGSLGFVLCPILDTTRGAVKALIGDGTGKGFLVELLTIRPLSKSSTPDLYNGWQVIRNIALGLYVLIFVLIIFGNGIGYDPYTIKRALPRLAAGVVLTFASWWILQTLVDLSNLVGNVVPALVSQMSGQAGVANYALDLNPEFVVPSIILLIVVALIALGALLIGVAGLVMRVVIIYGLVLLAPLAFLAWVLPNTESIFKKWWQNLVRVLMMFPIVTGMLSLSLFFQQIMLNTQTNAAGNTGSVGGSVSNSVAGIVGMLAPLIAIILIPKTFKWGGAMFAAAAGYMAAKATQGKDWGKSQGRDRVGKSMKEGYGARLRNQAATLGNKDGKLHPITSRLPGIGSPISKLRAEKAVGARAARINSKAKDGLDDIPPANLARIYGAMGQRQRNSPYGKSVLNTIKKKRGEATKDYAQALRFGQDTSPHEKKIKDIDEQMGGTYSAHTNATLNNIQLENDRAKGIPATRTQMDVPELLETGSPSPSRARQAWNARSGNRGQGGYIDPSAFRGSGGTNPTTPPPYNGPTPPTQPGSDGTGGGSTNPGSSGGHPLVTPSPPPSGNAPAWNNPSAPPLPPSTTPPPFRGTPPPQAPGGGGALLPTPPASTTPPPFTGTLPPSTTPPPFRGTPPPQAPGGGGALPPTPPASTTPPPFTGTLPPSTTPPTGGSSATGDTVYNVTNEVTNNVSTSRSANQTSPPGTVGGPVTIPSGALGDLARQFQMMRTHGGSSDGVARLESKINTLQDMITREGRNSNNVKKLMRTMRQEANNLPSHEQGIANDALSNFEHQAGTNDPGSSDGIPSGDI